MNASVVSCFCGARVFAPVDGVQCQACGAWLVGHGVLTVGALRRLLDTLPDTLQVVIDDGDGWFHNVEVLGVPIEDTHPLWDPTWSALTLLRGEVVDTRQF